ncbi:J domain-containing protein [Hephaestia mangrovi]|uniref:J domain-containing protein n=1 Tax=Hephaestia mangrovi TaxID=2873268 RepID=UPI001CA6E119|nr:J domain-containing protein [Hephaestia mangrovi]MBY8828746.1 J domain-containing protein [Hephaestia mangrovi]
MEKFVFLAVVAVAAWYWLKPRRKPRPVPRLDETEARAILGVSASDDDEAVRAAHRRLITAVHPDRGGSAELARRINLARDTLLARRD